MESANSLVFIVTGALPIRVMLCKVLRAQRKIAPRWFGSAAEYLACSGADVPSCVIVDADLPDMTGLELQQRMAKTHAPIVFVAQRADVSQSVRAMKAGAFDYLTLPVETSDMSRTIEAAIHLDRQTRRCRARLADWRARFSTLTARERQLMQKMAATSFADLVRMADALNITESAYGNSTAPAIRRALTATPFVVDLGIPACSSR